MADDEPKIIEPKITLMLDASGIGLPFDDNDPDFDKYPDLNVEFSEEDMAKWTFSVTIENPGVVPAIGDNVQFGLRDWTVYRRDIKYYGSSGPNKEVYVSVFLRDREKHLPHKIKPRSE